MKREEIIEALEHVTGKLKEKRVDVKVDADGLWCPLCENKVPYKVFGKRIKWCPFCGQRIEV